MWLFQVKGKNRLPNSIVKIISSEHVKIGSHMPVEFSRKPRPLDETPRWKATEFRSFLLYTGPVVLKEHLSTEMYLNFVVLSVATSIMLSNTYHQIYLNYADSLMFWFVKNFAKIYGEQYISHNIHGLIHLKDDVLQFGPLDECSAFPFENFMYSIKKLLIRKPEKPLQQYARRYAESDCNVAEAAYSQPSQTTPILKGNHSNGPILLNCCGSQYTEVRSNMVNLHTSTGNNCCRMKNGNFILISNIIEKNRKIFLIGRKFNIIKDFFFKPCKSSKIGIHYLSNLGELSSYNLMDVDVKCVLLPNGNGFVVFPLLHF